MEEPVLQEGFPPQATGVGNPPTGLSHRVTGAQAYWRPQHQNIAPLSGVWAFSRLKGNSILAADLLQSGNKVWIRDGSSFGPVNGGSASGVKSSDR